MFDFHIDIENEIKKNKERYKAVIDAIQPQLGRVITPDIIKGIRKIYIAGCGDSLFAALGSRLFFEKVTGLDIEPIEAMEFSRYTVENIKTDALVLAVSNSGRVSRLIEAILKARKKGVYTIALTGHNDRSAARNADASIVAAMPNIRSALDSISSRVEEKEQDEIFERISEPGVICRNAEKLGMGTGLDFLLFMLGAYTNSLLLLYCTAVHIGLTLRVITSQQAKLYHSEIIQSVEILARTANASLAPVESLANRFITKDAFLFLGAGPSYAVAALSAAKLFEQPHINGVSQQLEEWAHLQFFFTRPDGLPIFVIVPPGASRDRALEQISGIKKLGGTVVAVCNDADETVREMAEDAILVQGNLPEELVPLVYGVPGQLLAVALLDLKGQPPIPAPYSFKQMLQVNFQQIYASKIKDD
ncbi:MAG: SIS domain-containing protein [Spirochaetota bacterium]